MLKIVNVTCNVVLYIFFQVLKDAAASNDKKRLFYSTLMNDNPLDCIVSKVKVLQIPPGVC